MKNILILVMIFASVQLFAMKNVEPKVLQDVPLFQKSGIKVKKVIDAGSLYIVNVQFPNGAPDTVYFTKDKQYILTGDAISANTGAKLEMPVDMSILKGKEAFTVGHGKRELVLFTDTQCPYCKKFEAFFPQILDKVKIRIFWFPLSHHQEAFDISMYIMSKKTDKEKLDALLNITADSIEFKNRNISKKEQEAFANMINQHMQLGGEIGVQGTPTLLDMDGKKVNWMLMLQEYGFKVR
jgi:thiol:disulfide interchange protein DsbC